MAVTAVVAAVSYGATAIATTAVAGVIGAGITANIAGAVIGGVVAGQVNGALFGGGSPAPSQVGAQQARGMLLNAASSIDPLSVIYGSRPVGGTYVVPPFVSGANNEYLHLVISLCEGEISAINTVCLDGVASSDARYAGLVTIEKFTGSDTQAASALLLTDLPGWSSAHQGKGVAYLHAKIKYSQNAFHGIPVVTCDLDGKLVYDPRDTTTKFSNNPALCLRDYLTSTRYGRGIGSTLIDDASFIAAANHCDELVNIPGGTQARYTCDGVVNVDDTAYANVQRLLSSCRGMLVFSGGVYKLVIDKAETPSAFTFNEDNITGAWEFSRPGKRDLVNKVTAGYFNPDNDWQPDFAIQSSATYLSADNGLLLERKIDAPFTANHYRAAHLAQLEMKSSRFGLTVKFGAFQEGLRCEVGDVVPITHGTPGWTAKPFRILTIDILDSDNVTITAREYDDAAYTLDALDAVATAPQTSLPDPFSIAAPTGLTLTSGTAELLLAGDGTVISRIKAAFTPPTDAFLERYEVQGKKSADSIWQTWMGDSAATAVWLSPVDDGVSYDVRIRAENVMGARSDWATVTNHNVIGKTAPPSDVASLTATQLKDGVQLSWPSVSDPDLDIYEIRVGGTGWDDATPIDHIRANNFKVAPIASGSFTWRIKAEDTSGNYSVNAATASLTVNAPAAPVVSAGLAGASAYLSWTVPAASLEIKEYEVRYGASWAAGTSLGTIKGTRFDITGVDWSGARTFWVAAIDTSGNEGAAGSNSIAVNAAAAPSVSFQVIDNNVLFYWNQVAGSLPTLTYELRKGATWATAAVIGTKSGGFTTVFETQAGVYTYWFAAIDSAGNYGTPASVAVTVSAPPDYILKSNYDSDWSGTFSNAVPEPAGSYLLPIDPSITWQQHFVNNSWATPQDQVSAGFPIYIQPSEAAGYYEETIDYGTTLASNRVTVTLASENLSGATALVCKISVSDDDISYTDYDDVWQIYAAQFRYVKVRITATTAAATDVVRFVNLNVRLDSKLKTITGMLACNSGDAGGTTFHLTVDGTPTGDLAFIDVDAITITPAGTTPLTAMYDFSDVPNPASMKVLLFDNTGARASGTASVMVRGF